MNEVGVIGGTPAFAELLALELSERGFRVAREVDQASVVVVCGGTEEASGERLVAEVRRKRPQAPIVLLTGSREALWSGYQAGATRVLGKPFELGALVEALAALDSDQAVHGRA